MTREARGEGEAMTMDNGDVMAALDALLRAEEGGDA